MMRAQLRHFRSQSRHKLCRSDLLLISHARTAVRISVIAAMVSCAVAIMIFFKKVIPSCTSLLQIGTETTHLVKDR